MTEDLEPNAPEPEETISEGDSLREFLMRNLNMGFTSKQLAQQCEIRIPPDFRFSPKRVDIMLQDMQMPDGIRLRHIQHQEVGWLWAAVQ